MTDNKKSLRDIDVLKVADFMTKLELTIIDFIRDNNVKPACQFEILGDLYLSFLAQIPNEKMSWEKKAMMVANYIVRNGPFIDQATAMAETMTEDTPKN
jgi:hypothetical protein